LLDLYREFDEECKSIFIFSDEIGKKEKDDVQKRAAELYEKLKSGGYYLGKTGDALEILKKHLQELQENLRLFVPENVQDQESDGYIERLCNWLKTEKIEIC